MNTLKQWNLTLFYWQYGATAVCLSFILLAEGTTFVFLQLLISPYLRVEYPKILSGCSYHNSLMYVKFQLDLSSGSGCALSQSLYHFMYIKIIRQHYLFCKCNTIYQLKYKIEITLKFIYKNVYY